jgi:hypothetical protein
MSLEHNIVPRLKAEAPSQPSEQELQADSLRSGEFESEPGINGVPYGLPPFIPFRP